jgi:hypothetical protein
LNHRLTPVATKSHPLRGFKKAIAGGKSGLLSLIVVIFTEMESAIICEICGSSRSLLLAGSFLKMLARGKKLPRPFGNFE